jgi:uncharacterized protein YaiL (DUF2058 family)
MGNSLRDQLLKAGLVSEQQIKQTQSKKRKQKRAIDPDEQARQREAARAAAEKKRHDLELNRQRDEEARRKAEVVALWQLVRDNRIARDHGDLAYNFSDGKTLKRLYVNSEQQRGLVEGRLAIVRQDAFYELVPVAIAERLAAHDPALVLVHNQPADDGDDDYAEYKVPDDLIW